jgi:hypothetical protein
MRALILMMLLAGVAVADPTPSTGDDAGNGFKATKGAFGLGLVLGEPTGICAKLYLADDRAIDAEAGATFIAGGLQLSGDYLFHPVILQDRDSFVMPFYVGPGLRLIDYTGSTGYFAAGLRGVVGLAFDFKNAPIDAFVEAAVVVETGFSKAHEIGAALNAGVGARYYF